MSYLSRSKTSKPQKNVNSSSEKSVYQPNPSSLAHGIQRLQQTAGNQATSHLLQQIMLSSSSAQADLSVQPASSVCGVPPIVHDVLKSPGQPLDHTTRSTMETRFGHDFSQVRIHTDEQAASSARSIDANAYTVGQNIVFDTDRYTPHTRQGKTLLAHELTHVLQFARQPVVALGIAPPHHPSEQEAARVSSQPSSLPVAAPGGMIQRDEKKSAGITEDVLSVAAKGLEIHGAATSAQVEFVMSFLETAKKVIPPDTYMALSKELQEPENAALFAAGEEAGILLGIVKDVGGTLLALGEMAVKASPVYQIGSEIHSLIQKGLRGYKDEKLRNYEQVRAIAGKMLDFGQAVVKEPQILVQSAHELGVALAKRSAEWFTQDFMKLTPFHKGKTVGVVIGYVIAEIAMLFIGPEEIAIRGGALAAKAAEGTRLGRAVLEALEKIPAFAKILEARKLMKTGSEAVEIGEKVGEVAQKGAAPVEKVVTSAGKETHVAEAVEEKAVAAPIAGAEEVKVSPSEYQAALGHTFPAHFLEPITRTVEEIGQGAAQRAVNNPAFVQALQNRNWTLAGTLFHSAAATEARALPAGRLPAGWVLDAELTVQSGRGGSRADILLRGPSGAIIEFDWKTTGRSALTSGARKEMQKHAGQILTNIGGSLTAQESRSWVDFVKPLLPGMF